MGITQASLYCLSGRYARVEYKTGVARVTRKYNDPQALRARSPGATRRKAQISVYKPYCVALTVAGAPL
jgi:hypothetical protein